MFHVKGKVVFDIVCNPLGKSRGALIQQFSSLGLDLWQLQLHI